MNGGRHADDQEGCIGLQAKKTIREEQDDDDVFACRKQPPVFTVSSNDDFLDVYPSHPSDFRFVKHASFPQL